MAFVVLIENINIVLIVLMVFFFLSTMAYILNQNIFSSVSCVIVIKIETDLNNAQYPGNSAV